MTYRSGLVRFHDSVVPLLVDIDAVSQHPANPRNGDIDAIAESIEVNGYIAPVIAQKSTGYILAGNHRYHALYQLRSEVIPVLWVDVDDVQAKHYLLADNHTSDLAVNDNSALLELLTVLDNEDALVGSTFTKHDIEQLEALAEVVPDYTDHASWPTLSLTVPPHLKNAFYEFTEHAVSDHDRLEMLLRMAGWQEEK